MLIRPIILLTACLTITNAVEGPTREKLRAQLAEASQELARVSRAVNLIHELVAPSVVSIHTSEKYRVATFSGRSLTREVEVGEGSGFVFHTDDKASYILTNAHVVLQTNNEQQFVQGRNGQPIGYDSIRVVLTDSREVQAEYIGVYVESDLAVLKIPLTNIPALEFANSDAAKVGDYVVALGYPLGVGYSATSGIISATDRSTGIYQGVGGFDSFIQTDAAINPGNSGGPLVDITGRVIGVNASIISKTGVNIGLGFAIPSNLAQHIATDLRQFGKVRRPMIGINLDHLDPEKAKAMGLPPVQTVRITGVIPEGPAAQAGLQAGDAILGINQTSLVSLQQFQARVASLTLGDSMTLRVWRAGKEFDLKVTPVAEETLKSKLLALASDTATKRGLPLKEFGLWLAADDQAGLRISTIETGSIAEKAGLKVGDRLLHERSHGALATTEDVAALDARRELIVQVYQDGRSFWLRLRR
jgi:S1-C subfamily serine protease